MREGCRKSFLHEGALSLRTFQRNDERVPTSLIKRPDSLDTLKIAAYVTWVGVLLGVWRSSGELPALAGIPARAVTVALLLVFLGAFFATARVRSTALALMLVSEFSLLVLDRSDTIPVLLIVIAAVIAVQHRPVVASALIVAINVAFAVVLIVRWHRSPWLMLAINAGFQFFAAYAAHAVRRADESADELRQVNAHLVATRLVLAESARDGERLRLSRELHDVSGHKLTALKLNLAVLAKSQEVAEHREFQAARSLVDELLHDIRGVVAQLRHHDGIDLREAFTRLAEPMPFAQVHVQVDEDARVDDAERAAALIRLAQEGLTNAAKHASPKNVWLRLTREQDLLQLVVEDDGRLADPVRPGHGLTGMHERVVGLGGELQFGVTPAGGMRICARLPRGHAA